MLPVFTESGRFWKTDYRELNDVDVDALTMDQVRALYTLADERLGIVIERQVKPLSAFVARLQERVREG